MMLFDSNDDIRRGIRENIQDGDVAAEKKMLLEIAAKDGATNRVCYVTKR